MILGITGKIASGKTTLAENIVREGFVEDAGQKIVLVSPCVMEVDRLGHALLAQARIKNQLIAAFGPEIVVDADLSRSHLARLAFADRASLARLEGILHPPMLAELERVTGELYHQNRDLILVAALPKSFLFDRFCDRIIFLPIDKEAAFRRATNRSSQLSLPMFNTLWERQTEEYS